MKIVNLTDTEWSQVSHNPAIRKRIILSQGELPGITTLSQAIFKPGDVATGHAHQDMSEVFLVAAGEGIIRINGQEYPLNPDIVAVAEPNDVHEIENTGDNPLILTYLGVRTI